MLLACLSVTLTFLNMIIPPDLKREIYNFIVKSIGNILAFLAFIVLIILCNTVINIVINLKSYYVSKKDPSKIDGNTISS